MRRESGSPRSGGRTVLHAVGHVGKAPLLLARLSAVGRCVAGPPGDVHKATGSRRRDLSPFHGTKRARKVHFQNRRYLRFRVQNAQGAYCQCFTSSRPGLLALEDGGKVAPFLVPESGRSDRFQRSGDFRRGWWQFFLSVSQLLPRQKPLSAGGSHLLPGQKPLAAGGSHHLPGHGLSSTGGSHFLPGQKPESTGVAQLRAGR